MTSKNFIFITIISTIVIILIFSFLVVYIDPFFHYRKPNSNSQYILNHEHFQNDGIVKHFEYNAIITGTSMVENFKTSELDKLFDVHSIKVPFAGAMFKEINDILITATKYNKNIKLIIRCLDIYKLNEPKDVTAYSKKDYPDYLYDNNIYNDYKYLLNKNAIANAIATLLNFEKTSFDSYASWNNKYIFSEEMVKNSYNRQNKKNDYIISENDYFNLSENIKYNITNLADQNPNIDFYLFYPPYSIYYWDNANQNGVLKLQLECIEYTTKELLKHPNIHLYSFLDEYEIINDLNNYKDIRHYNEKINSLILQKFKNEENVITKDNFEKKLKEMNNYYLNYDYNSLFNK